MYIYIQYIRKWRSKTHWPSNYSSNTGLLNHTFYWFILWDLVSATMWYGFVQKKWGFTTILLPFIVGTMRISLGIESSPCSNQWQTISTNNEPVTNSDKLSSIDGWCISQQLHILHLCISNRQKDAELATRHQPPTGLIDQYFLLI